MNSIQQQHPNLNKPEQVSNQIAVKIPTSHSFWIQLVSFITLFLCYFLSLDNKQRYVQATMTYFYICPNRGHLCKWVVMYPYLMAFALCFMLLAIFSRFKAQQLRWKADWMIIFDLLAIAFTFITIFLFIVFNYFMEGGTFEVFPLLPILISLSLILQFGMFCFYDLKLRKQILVNNPEKLEILYSKQLFLQLAAIIFASIVLCLELVEQEYYKKLYYSRDKFSKFKAITLVTGQQQQSIFYDDEEVIYNIIQLRFPSCFDYDFCNFVVVLPYMIGLFLFFTIIQIICRNQGKQVYGLSLLLGVISELLLIILFLMLIIFSNIPFKGNHLIRFDGHEPSVYYYLDEDYILIKQNIMVGPIILLGFCGIFQGISIRYDYQQRIRELIIKQ